MKTELLLQCYNHHMPCEIPDRQGHWQLCSVHILCNKILRRFCNQVSTSARNVFDDHGLIQLICNISTAMNVIFEVPQLAENFCLIK